MGAAATTDLLYTGLYLCGNIPDFSHIIFTSRWWCTEDDKRKFVISILLVSCDWYNAKCAQFFMPITSVGLSNHFASLMLFLQDSNFHQTLATRMSLHPSSYTFLVTYSILDSIAFFWPQECQQRKISVLNPNIIQNPLQPKLWPLLLRFQLLLCLQTSQLL